MYRSPMGNRDRDVVCLCDNCKRKLYPGAIAYEIEERVFCQLYCEEEAMEEIRSVYQDTDYKYYLGEVHE